MLALDGFGADELCCSHFVRGLQKTPFVDILTYQESREV